MQYPRRHYEIFRFEQLDLLYRVYLFEDGEIAFTATGDPIRMGLFTQEDVRWSWEWLTNLPATEETSQRITVGPLTLPVLRTIARHLAQYLAKHRPEFFYYRVSTNAKLRRVYRQLFQRHAAITSLYEPLEAEDGKYVMWSLNHSAALQAA